MNASKISFECHVYKTKNGNHYNTVIINKKFDSVSAVITSLVSVSTQQLYLAKRR